ncbi:MAG: Fe-S cluster assembly protein SufD, partial [Bacteroidota bacterium]
EAYEDFDKALNLGGLQEKSLEALENLDFPTTRHEEWKYFNLRPLLRTEFAFRAPTQASATPWFDPKAVNLLTFVNGVFSDSRSQIREKSDKIVIESLASALARKESLLDTHLGKYTDTNENIFTHLNTAFAQDGVFISLGKSAELEFPVVIHHVIDAQDGNTLIQPRNLVIAAENSSAKILEVVTTVGEGSSLMNGVSEFVVARDARIFFHKVQNDTENAFQINQTFVEQDDNCTFSDNTFSLSGAMVRNNLYLGLGSHNESYMNGFFLLNGKTVVDNHTVVDHRKPHSMSDELYKGILDDRSTGIFNGKIFVRQDAQKTNAFQSNANVLLSDQATIDTKPQLEIWADDVRCTHGATTGALDEEQLFYLRARGIGERKAKAMLMKAFVGEVLDRLEVDFLRTYLEEKIEERLG